MIRNLKVLGLALIAVFAMSAMAASAASAQLFTTETNTTTIRGEDSGVVELSVTGVGITCSEVSYHATTGTSASSVTADPSYKGCKTSLGTEARVTGFGDWGEEASKQCDFILYATGKADLSCPTGVDVTVDAGPCTVHMPSQSGLGTITYTTGTRNGKHDLILHLGVEKITTNHTDGFFCPLPSGGHSATATLNGTITVWGEHEGNPVAVTHHSV